MLWRQKEPKGHGFAKDNVSSAVDGLRAGTDLDCDTFSKNHVYNHHAAEAVNRSLLSLSTLDLAVQHLTMVQMQLGLYDNNKEQQQYAQIPASIVGSAEHQALNREATRQSLTLLKNSAVADPYRVPGRRDKTRVEQTTMSSAGVASEPVLPLKSGIKLAVIGKHFNSTGKLSSDYSGPLCHSPPQPGNAESCIESPLAAFTRLNKGGQTVGAVGCCAYGYTDNISAAVAMAKQSDATVLMVGLTGKDEGEGHDRVNLDLEPIEQQLVAAVLVLNKPTVLVTIHGGALALGNFTHTAPAILGAWNQLAGVLSPCDINVRRFLFSRSLTKLRMFVVDANYPGAQFGATTIAEAVFGHFSPSGR